MEIDCKLIVKRDESRGGLVKVRLEVGGVIVFDDFEHELPPSDLAVARRIATAQAILLRQWGEK